MELRHLRYFIAVAEHRHFGRAAQSLGIRQPPLSQQIQSLEKELGTRLFDRTSRSVELTKAGHAFITEARKTLRHADQAVASASRAARGHNGQLRIGFIGSAIYSILPALLREFRSRYPGVSLEPVELTSADQAYEIDALRLDVGFVRPPLRAAHGLALASLPVAREHLLVAVSRNHRLAGHRSIPLSFLAEEPLILAPSEGEASLRSKVLQVCSREGFEPVVGGESGQLHTVLGLVAAGVGVGIGPDSVAKVRLGETVYRPLRPAIAAPDLTMVWRAGNDRPVAANFVDMVRGLCRAETGATAITG
ncbi:LysR family transcriptional regulator [Amycolatopsis sp. NPDC059021]|uniref:LysR family transcriptional regulator n=1 Tax=Amycolatopsis sp. NPDC059021 TaxID=3346704 RepID=UPI003672DE59